MDCAGPLATPVWRSRSALKGFVKLTGFTPNLGKLWTAALRNVNGLASHGDKPKTAYEHLT